MLVKHKNSHRTARLSKITLFQWGGPIATVVFNGELCESRLPLRCFEFVHCFDEPTEYAVVAVQELTNENNR